MVDDSNRNPTGRPVAGEYASYAREDIDRVEGDDALAALAAQGRRVGALLDGLDDGEVAGLRYAPGKWTFKEVVGHLIDDERIFAHRALALARGDATPLPGFEERDYVAAAGFEQRTLGDLAAEYAAVRAATLALFAGLPDGAWARRGIVNGYEATVRGLAFHIAGHELRHLAALAGKYLARTG